MKNQTPQSPYFRVRPFKISPGRGGERLRDFTFTSAVYTNPKSFCFLIIESKVRHLVKVI